LIKNVSIPKSNIKITYYFSFLIFLGFILVILNYLRYPQNPISLVPFTYLLSVIFITIAYSSYLNEKVWSSFSIFDCLTVLRNVIFFNSLIIIAEFIFPSIRDNIEIVLYQDIDSNIDYSTSIVRFRGIASAGGATLSMLHAFGAIISLYLLVEGRSKSLISIIIFFAISFSIFLIGRTGIISLFIGIALLAIYQMFRSWSLILKFWKNFLYMIIIGLVFLGSILTFLSEKLDDYLLNYIGGFILNGFEGVEDEGTVSIIQSFYRLPNSMIDFFIGTGSWTGSFYDGFSDSGFMKVLTNFGFFYSIFYYGALLFILKYLTKSRINFIYFVFFILLIVGQIKEQFFYTGYLFRAFLFLAIFDLFKSPYVRLNSK
jgi:hypothetical protein